jgi:TolC family type I secretion outer membrane protein
MAPPTPRSSRSTARVLAVAALLLAGVFLLAVPVGWPAQAQETQPAADGSSDSLRIEAVVQHAIETYPAVDAARRRFDAAGARVGQARSSYWPHVTAVGAYRRQDPVPEVDVPGGSAPETGRSIAIQPNNQYDGRLAVRQTVYDFGRTRARVDAAEADRDRAEREISRARSEIAFESVDAFTSALLARARVAVQTSQIERLERTLAVVRRRQDAGTATEFEVQSTQARLSAARSTQSRLRSEHRRQMAELRRLLGRPVDQPISLRASLSPQFSHLDTDLLDTDSLQAVARENHPAVRVARARAAASRQSVRVADRTNAPSLQLEAEGGWMNGFPGDLNEMRLNESVGITLSVPLFDGFSTERRVEEASAGVREAEARLSDVRRRVETGVTQAASDLRALIDRLDATQERVDQARLATDLARTRYEAGTITNLDLLEAQTELQEAQLEQTEVRYRIVIARYALRAATGTLLPFEPLSRP